MQEIIKSIENEKEPLKVTSTTRRMFATIAKFHALDSEICALIDDYFGDGQDPVNDNYEKVCFEYRAFLYETLQTMIEENIGNKTFKGL